MIDRREFLKLGGATAFAALFSACERLPKTIVPFVIPPENYTLGESLWYASLCRMCPAGCGILVRVSEGRAKKIEGNPLHPVNRGKLCARGQAALQALYHPERIGKPHKRDGPRGSGKFRPISWEEALRELVAGLTQTRAADPAALLMLGEPLRGHRNLVAARFMTAFGSPHRIAWDPLGLDALLAANEAVFGIRDVPEYDIAQASYLLSFSGDFLETWLSPVHFGHAFGRMRNARETIRGKFVHFGSRLSMTAACADLFLPAAPGTEGIAALGIAHVMVREKLTPEAAAAGPALWRAGLSAWTPEAVAARSGTPPTALAGVAREFARARPQAIALAGTAAGTTTNGAFNHACAALLNVLCGSVGKPGGIAFPDRAAAFPRAAGDPRLLLPPPESGYGALRGALDRMRAGKFRMALLHGTANPAFTLPAALRFEEALGGVPFVVSFASFFDETVALSDLVLPVPTFLEEWGDDAASAGHAGNALTLAQPAVEPFHDTRSMEDVLIAVARELGGPLAAALPWRNFRGLLEAAYGGTNRFEEALRAGGIFREEAAGTRRITAGRPVLPNPEEPAFEGDPARYPFVLLVFPSIALADGRWANLPWLQELPDPVSTAVWRNWVELNPATAAKMGLSDGEGVAVESPFGRIEAHVALNPGVMPGIAAVPLGQGHTRYGKFAAGRGGNPFTLLPAARESCTGGPAWQSTRVKVEKAKVQGTLARAAHREGQWKIGNLM